MVEVGIDDDIHGQGNGLFAVVFSQFLGSDEVQGDDVKDFMLDGAFHLFRRQSQEQEGIEVDLIAGAFKVDTCRGSQIEADALCHLEEKVSEELIPVFHEVAVDAAQEGEKFILKISRYLRFRIGPDIILENIVGDYRCLLVEESGFNGNGLFHPFYRRERKAAK